MTPGTQDTPVCTQSSYRGARQLTIRKGLTIRQSFYNVNKLSSKKNQQQETLSSLDCRNDKCLHIETKLLGISSIFGEG